MITKRTSKKKPHKDGRHSREKSSDGFNVNNHPFTASATVAMVFAKELFALFIIIMKSKRTESSRRRTQIKDNNDNHKKNYTNAFLLVTSSRFTIITVITLSI